MVLLTLAYIALAYWSNSEHFPLPKSTAVSMADERIKMFFASLNGMRERSDAQDFEFTFTHSLGLVQQVSDNISGESRMKAEEKDDRDDVDYRKEDGKTEHSPPGLECSASDDNTDSASDADSDTDFNGNSSLRPVTPSSPRPSHGQSLDEDFPLEIPLGKGETSIHLQAAVHGSRRLLHRRAPTLSEPMELFNGGSPSKTAALFQMPGWSKPKILVEDEKRDIFAADFEEGRNKAGEGEAGAPREGGEARH
ncbi:hypothetical protein B0H19DRAFT_1262283 [Mycena capillaripes]|nr:hypothetical protein B0H19DRAFT_1262283 [Mycena capillaripes]